MRSALFTRDFISRLLKKRRRWAVAASLCMLSALSNVSVADEVAFDDFENVTLVPFDTPFVGVGDGTDWTNSIPNWTIDNSEMGRLCEELAFNGWTAMDVDSWIAEQGPQIGRTALGAGTNNTALIADPDAWDDYPLAGGTGSGIYNSYISRTYDISTADLNSLAISFDYEFAVENNQQGLVQVSFDGGANYTTLLNVGAGSHPNDTVLRGPITYVAGVDFTPVGNSMILRIGCVNAGNNWWFAVDNVDVVSLGGYQVFDNFEGLALEQFGVAAGEPVGDGTDYSQDIPEWTIDNSQMLTRSTEGAFDGWSAMDVVAWINEQGPQGNSDNPGRSMFNDFPFEPHNTIMVADPDAHDDYDTELDADDPLKAFKEFNSFVYREYDVTNFANTTLKVSLDWEFRIEDEQRGLIQASFDGGTNWVNLLDIDSDNIDSLVALSQFQFANNPNSSTFSTVDTGPQLFEFGGFGSAIPASNSNKMILRIGCVDSQNNWWFAFDNVLVEADPQNFLLGDANDDGSIDFLDIDAFVLAILDDVEYANQFPSVDPNTVLDFDADGLLTFGDIDGFVYLILN